MSILKNVGLVVGGAVIGVGATYKYFHDKFEGFANEEIESVKQKVREKEKVFVGNDTLANNNDDKSIPYTQHVKSMYGKDTTPEKAVDGVVNKGRTKAPDIDKAQKKQDDVDKLSNRTRKDVPFRKSERTAYDKVIRQYDPLSDAPRPPKEEEVIDFSKEEDYASEQVDEVKADRPYVISADQFVENDQDFEQITITYFSKDDVLADEDGEPIEDIDAVIGDASIGKFGTMGSPDNLVYVRNEKMMIDYEVIREDLSWEFDEKDLHH